MQIVLSGIEVPSATVEVTQSYQLRCCSGLSPVVVASSGVYVMGSTLIPTLAAAKAHPLTPMIDTLARLDSASALLGDEATADVLSVDVHQLARWRAGQPLDPEQRDRIIGLDATLTLLSGFLAESSIPKWLMSVNAHMGGRRPIALLRDDRASEVIAAIEAMKAGAYA
jgi:hypothetical protein